MPADEYLPAGVPRLPGGALYPVDGPDLATAKQLAQGHLRGGQAMFLACGSQACVERALVVKARWSGSACTCASRRNPGLGQFTLAGVKGTKFDIADVITRPDYGDPYALVDKLLDSRVIRAVGNTNLSYFDEPAVRPRDRRGAAA